MPATAPTGAAGCVARSAVEPLGARDVLAVVGVDEHADMEVAIADVSDDRRRQVEVGHTDVLDAAPAVTRAERHESRALPPPRLARVEADPPSARAGNRAPPVEHAGGLTPARQGGIAVPCAAPPQLWRLP